MQAADILVVEDDPTICRLLCDIFTLGGGSVRIAPTVAAAAEQISAAPPALLTLDLNLPGASGQQLLEQMRTHPETSKLPVIVITSQLPVNHSVHAMAEAVVAKPFELTELLDAVNRVLPGHISLAA